MRIEEWLAERSRINGAATPGPWSFIKDSRLDGTKVFRVGSKSTGEDVLSVPRYRNDDDGVEIADAVVDAHDSLPKLAQALHAVLEVLEAAERDGDPADLVRRVGLEEIRTALGIEEGS